MTTESKTTPSPAFSDSFLEENDLLYIRYFSLVYYHKMRYSVNKLKKLVIDEKFINCCSPQLEFVLLLKEEQ